MIDIDSVLRTAAISVLPKPPEDSSQAIKKRFSETLSAAMALAFAEILRSFGLDNTRPAPPGVLGSSGAERRIAGGIGAKKVDVTWTTEESGLILAVSIKSINFKDRRTQNFQKNVVNRRGDMLMEAVTLHRRFPYAVLCGIFFLDAGANADATDRRKNTFVNTHTRLRLFTDRPDPAGRDEQFERMYIALFDTDNEDAPFEFYAVGKPDTPVPAIDVITDLLDLVVQRNPDLYSIDDGKIVKQR